MVLPPPTKTAYSTLCTYYPAQAAVKNQHLDQLTDPCELAHVAVSHQQRHHVEPEHATLVL